MTPWNVKIDEFVVCNCAYGCPCQFSAPPTYGSCEAVAGFHITEGHYGKTDLSGVKMAAVLQWPGAIHEGGGSLEAIVDEKATDAQREAVLKIMTGQDTEPMATMFSVYTAMSPTIHEPHFAPIDFTITIEERTARLNVPGIIESRGEPIRHDRVVVALGLIGVAAVSWLYLLAGAGMDMEPMQHGAMTMHPQIPVWNISYLLVMFAMWWVMMIAMMLPSAAPMILLFAAANTKAATSRSAKVPTSIFAAGYLLVWGGFSLLATLLQWGLSSARLLDKMMQTNSNLLAAGLLIAAGAYQFSPLKTACLRHCRGPVQFISQHWQPGRVGALKMGLLHGTFCLGCCWFLMAMLFYGGVMNLLWIGGLALYVLVEKLAPRGDILCKITGVGLLIWGLSLLWPLISNAV